MTETATPMMDRVADVITGVSGEPHRTHAGVHVADAMIALLAGHASVEGKQIAAMLARIDPSPLGTIAVHASVMRLTEIDDIHRPTAVTPSAIVVPAALGIMAYTGATQPTVFADAIVAGQEAAIGLATALGGAHLLAKGLWPSYVVAPFAAAAAAGRMLELPASRMRHALALALAQTPGAIGRSTGSRPGRWVLFGNAVRSGCVAAMAAADGIDGDPDLLSETWLRTLGGNNANPAALTSHAAPPVIRQLSIKPHSSAKQVLTALHGLQQLIARGISPTDITRIRIDVPTAYAQMINREPAWNSRLASLVSAPGQLALAALAPAALDDVSRDTLVWTDELMALAKRIEVHADPTLDPLYPFHWPANVTINVGSTQHRIDVRDSPGDPALAFHAGEVHDKARRLLGRHPALDLVAAGLRAPFEVDALEALGVRLRTMAMH